MAKFCTKCGKKLEEGQKCTCEKIKKQSNNNTNDFMKDIKDFIKYPIDNLKNIKTANTSYILLLISSIAIGLVTLWFSPTRYLNHIISTVCLSFIFMVLFTFILKFLLNNFNKKEIEFNQILSIVATSSLILTIGSIVGIILSYISSLIFIVIMISCILLFIVYIYHGIMLNNDIDKNKIGYILILSLLITYLIFASLTKIL